VKLRAAIAKTDVVFNVTVFWCVCLRQQIKKRFSRHIW